MFSPDMWACASVDTCTTNVCESFHAHFNSSFNFTHPNIYVVIVKLKELQTANTLNTWLFRFIYYYNTIFPSYFYSTVLLVVLDFLHLEIYKNTFYINYITNFIL
jgi:hypothetical protein